MKTTEESVMAAMDCTNSEILPFLPYILQDFWEIGSNPETMISLIEKHRGNHLKIKVLDLGCGKGAVSINVAKQLNCKCFGVDAVPEFIAFAEAKSAELGVDHLCTFEVADIRERVKTLPKFDVIILGAIGQVFGDYFHTLTLLNHNLSENGLIIIDDGYVDDNCNTQQEQQVLSLSSLRKQISDADMCLIEEVLVEDENLDISDEYDKQYQDICKRCDELSVQYPDKAKLFASYADNQKIEYNNIKSNIICSTMLLKRKSEI